MVQPHLFFGWQPPSFICCKSFPSVKASPHSALLHCSVGSKGGAGGIHTEEGKQEEIVVFHWILFCTLNHYQRRRGEYRIQSTFELGEKYGIREKTFTCGDCPRNTWKMVLILNRHEKCWVSRWIKNDKGISGTTF